MGAVILLVAVTIFAVPKSTANNAPGAALN
jgi:hypothetical protein